MQPARTAVVRNERKSWTVHAASLANTVRAIMAHKMASHKVLDALQARPGHHRTSLSWQRLYFSRGRDSASSSDFAIFETDFAGKRQGVDPDVERSGVDLRPYCFA